MLIGSVDIYANHPVIFIGSTDPLELDWDDGPACGDGKHIVVQTRGQTAPTRVSVWNGAMPIIGNIVFDGVLNVEDRVCVVDLEDLTRWITRLIEPGPQRVVVCADDPGHASRVHVGFELSDQVLELTAVARHPLPPVMAAPDGALHRTTELGLILDGHDSPLARLAAAIKVLAAALEDEPRPYPYYVRLVTEWLRGLAGHVRLAQAEALGREIADRLRADRATGTHSLHDEAVWALATHIMELLTFPASHSGPEHQTR
ncbi:hypothetical protein ACFCX0_03195 [Streptomyces sp. NPDC056352]|uniref:hypothetical protein n=1 Tax=Streptomyces sp. NPDC056352 TaxID=3345791 RepID=UPI0035DBFF31